MKIRLLLKFFLLATMFAAEARSQTNDAASSDGRRRFALLIGVTDYPADVVAKAKIKPLTAPKNDVTLLHHTLVESGVPAENIRVIADSLETSHYSNKITAHARPTRVEILKRLQWLIETARAGDQVVVYFAGHGTQVKEVEKLGVLLEDDGQNEAILPIDIEDWTPGKPIKNQILDDEIGERLTVLIKRGTFVWFIVDACHSGTVVRSAGSSAAARVFPATVLSVPAKSGKPSRPQPPMALGATGRTGFVAFYASHPSQPAYEESLPLHAPKVDQRPHGLLTWHLIQALRSGRTGSYETLAQRIIAGYFEWGSETVARPMFDGDLAAVPFIGQGGERTYRIEVENGSLLLRAGLLDDVQRNTIVAVGEQNAADRTPLFYARVTEASAEASYLERQPEEFGRPERLAAMTQYDFMKFATASAPNLFAQLIERRPSFVLRVEQPTAAEPDDAALADRVGAALRDLVAMPPEKQPAAVEIVGPDGANVRMVIAGGRVWFLSKDEPLVRDGPRKAFSLSVAEADAGRIGAALRIIARARNLTRIADEDAKARKTRSMRVRVGVEHSKPVAETEACAPHPDVQPTMIPFEAMPAKEATSLSSEFLRVAHCNKVYIAIENAGPFPLDVTPLYIDPWSQIYFLDSFPDSAISGLRVAPGQTQIVSYTEVTASTPEAHAPVGYGRIVLLAVKGDKRRGSLPQDFRHLTGRLPISARRDAGAPEPLRRMLDAAGFGSGAVRGSPGGGDAEFIVIPFETLAPGEER